MIHRVPPLVRLLPLLCALALAACGVIGPSKADVEDAVVEMMPVIAQWKPDALKPYGTAAFNQRIDQPRQSHLFLLFSELGELDSFQPPRMTGWESSTGAGTLVRVEVDAKFAHGPATIVMTLRSEGGKLKLHALNIRSPVFGDPSAQPEAPQQV
ncbi:MAG: hypothetical protein GC201_11970 [Alphaproteobacteria bacterium]|nr:hypothetical protein [Alphaproteobacteria bacterium]